MILILTAIQTVRANIEIFKQYLLLSHENKNIKKDRENNNWKKHLFYRIIDEARNFNCHGKEGSS